MAKLESQSVADRAKKIIIEQMQGDESDVVPEANLRDDLGADSLDVVELVMQLEEAFDITISDEDADGIRTVQDVYDYLNKTLDQ